MKDLFSYKISPRLDQATCDHVSGTKMFNVLSIRPEVRFLGFQEKLGSQVNTRDGESRTETEEDTRTGWPANSDGYPLLTSYFSLCACVWACVRTEDIFRRAGEINICYPLQPMIREQTTSEFSSDPPVLLHWHSPTYKLKKLKRGFRDGSVFLRLGLIAPSPMASSS